MPLEPLMESKIMMMMTIMISLTVKFTTIYCDSLCNIDLKLDLMFCIRLNLHDEGEIKESDFWFL